MKLDVVKTPGLAHLSYVLSSGNEALVVDPRRDVEVYLDLLRRNGLRLRYVVGTHRQEDFVMGSAELARRTGARLVAGDHQIFRHADLRLADGQRLQLGQVHLLALHTPGHTPESMSYAVFEDALPNEAWAIFTGDTLFAGATGRTDLEDPARTGENGGVLYDAVHQKLLPLGDQALVLPAHGPGSPCGSTFASREPTTIGIERRTNAVFTLDRDTFIHFKEVERIPRPPYFARMRELNDAGGKPPPDIAAVPMLPPKEFAGHASNAVVIDTREPEGFAGGHIPGALSIWAQGLPVYAGWMVPPGSRVVLVTEAGADPDELLRGLVRVGIDRIEGVLAGGMAAWREDGRPIERSGTVMPAEVAEEFARLQRVDVREIGEFEEGHIPGARHAYVGELESAISRLGLRHDQPILVNCSTGHRSSLAASILLRHGFRNVLNLLGGIKAWRKQDLHLEQEVSGEAAEAPLAATIEERLQPH